MFNKLPMYQNIGESAYKKDLSNIILICEHLNNPQNNFKSIHIAGTNGKGSCSHMLSSIFQEAGYNVGLYTSPHLVDFRERIQTVNKKDNDLFHKLIKKFYEIKKVPILVNTSFNIKDEPIVNTIEDAYRCFLIADLDFLVCENYVLDKKKQY